MQDQITVNGVPLSEFLNENEPISDEEKRSRLFEQSNDPVFKYHKTRGKIEYKEKNGKVRIMNKHEINKANYEIELLTQLKDEQWQRCAVIIMMQEKKDFTIKTIIKILKEFAGKHNIDLPENINHIYRVYLAMIRRSEAGKYLIFTERKKNIKSNLYRFDDFFIENFTYLEAFLMLKNRRPTNETHNKTVEQKNEEVKQEVKIKDLVSDEHIEIKEKIENFVKDEIKKSTFTFGDIHLHFHINFK